MIEGKEPDAPLLTWEFKDDAWREVEHLPLSEAIRQRLETSAQTVRSLGLEDRIRDPRVRPPAPQKPPVSG